MHEMILDRLAKRAAPVRDDDEGRLNREIKRTLSKIKSKPSKSKNTFSNRGGLTSMGARGVFLKEGDIYSRRVVVKASYILAKNDNARGRIRHHLNYAGRNTLDAQDHSSELYARVDQPIDIKDALNDFEKAPHIFNIIISHEDGNKIDLKDFTRSFVDTIEKDLRTKLDWVAGNHYDTNEPHVHLLIKGLDDRGKKLLMTRDYISRGLRVRASQVINNKLGLRSLDEVVAALRMDIAKPKKSVLDDIIVKQSSAGVLNVDKINPNALDELPGFLIKQRLEFLQTKELAQHISDNSWRIKENLMESLKDIERSSSIVDKLGGSLTVSKQQCEILSVANLRDRIIKGHIVERGYVDEVSDKQYLVLKSKEKSFIYVELEKHSEKSPAQVGEFIRVDATKPFLGPKTSDATIAKFGQAYGGIYDANIHQAHAKNLPPSITAQEYAQVHVKRLEVLARKGIIEKLAEGRFAIPKDYLEKLAQEADKSKQSFQPHIKITRLSPTKVAKLNRGPRLSQ